MRPNFDPIGLIERSYRPAASLIDWMRAMAGSTTRAMHPSSNYACVYRLGPDGPMTPFFVQTSGRSQAEMTRELLIAHSSFEPQQLRAMRRAISAPGLVTSLEVTGRAPDSPMVQEIGSVDSPVVVVHPPEGPPVLFATLSSEPYRVDPSLRALWRRLSIHLSAGCRLAGRAATPEAYDVECVLTPGGRVVDARGEGEPRLAREQLRSAVQDIDRARTRRGRSNPDGALELWRGLVSGRWTLVDHFDSDGSRYLLARSNTPGVPLEQIALPLRQRQTLFFASVGWSNKEVGYALGIGESTVAAHLRRGLSALGVRTRSEWIRLVGDLTRAVQTSARVAVDELPME